MPSYGIVPALSSLRGAVGYFERGVFGDRQGQQEPAGQTEEEQSLLQVSYRVQLCTVCQRRLSGLPHTPFLLSAAAEPGHMGIRHT